LSRSSLRKQSEDKAVFVGGPDAPVAPQEGGPGGLFAYETERAVDQAVDKPLEAYRHFEHGAVEAFGYTIDDAGADESLADANFFGPLGTVSEEI